MHYERRRFPDIVSVVLLNNFEIKMFITAKYWCNEEYWPRLNIESGAYFNLEYWPGCFFNIEKWDQVEFIPGIIFNSFNFFRTYNDLYTLKNVLVGNFIYRQSFELCLITGTCCTRFKLIYLKFSHFFGSLFTRVLGIFEALP